MDDSERSYGYSRDLYHGARGVGGHYAGGHSERPHFERSYEYGAEGQADETSAEEAAMHVIEGTSLRMESGGATDGQQDYDRGATYGQVESFTWDLEGPQGGQGPRGARRSAGEGVEDVPDRPRLG